MSRYPYIGVPQIGDLLYTRYWYRGVLLYRGNPVGISLGGAAPQVQRVRGVRLPRMSGSKYYKPFRMASRGGNPYHTAIRIMELPL